VTDCVAWISRRQPRPPEPLLRWLEQAGQTGPVSFRVLLRPALRALERARLNPGRVRRSAFDLLGADALLTYACEAALESPDPALAFDALLSETAADHS
jgi:hypothetical protein